jgi:hypothetical protein
MSPPNGSDDVLNMEQQDRAVKPPEQRSTSPTCRPAAEGCPPATEGCGDIRLHELCDEVVREANDRREALVLEQREVIATIRREAMEDGDAD